MIDSALATAKRAGVTGMFTVRADSAYFQHDAVAAARRGEAHFSLIAHRANEPQRGRGGLSADNEIKCPPTGKSR